MLRSRFVACGEGIPKMVFPTTYSYYLAHCMQSAFSTVIILAICRQIALIAGLVDDPDERKRHEGKVPLVGGIGIFLAGALGAAAEVEFPATLCIFLALA